MNGQEIALTDLIKILRQKSMTKPEKDIAELFSSLRPAATDDRARANGSAQEAMARWPMLRSLNPASATTIPAVTAEEKASRLATNNVRFVTSKRALSLPTSTNKLAQSLAKMSARSRANVPAEITHDTTDKKLETDHSMRVTAAVGFAKNDGQCLFPPTVDNLNADRMSPKSPAR